MLLPVTVEGTVALVKTLLTVLLVATCAPQDPPVTSADLVRQRPPAERIVALETGEDVTEEELLADLERGRVIYIGEVHDKAEDHAVQYRLMRLLYERHPSIAVGMEMFQYPYQPVLDDWTDGRLDETNLRRRSEWDRRWGFDYALYRPILDWTRARAIPVLALNAPSEITRTVASEGLEGLSEAQRSELPPLDMDNEAHRAMVFGALGEHTHDGDDPVALERYYTAQVVWDETMAERVAEALERSDAPSRLVVLAGVMHVRGGLGIPSRASRRGATPYRVVLVAHDEEELESLMAAEPLPADYAWLVGEASDD